MSANQKYDQRSRIVGGKGQRWVDSCRDKTKRDASVQIRRKISGNSKHGYLPALPAHIRRTERSPLHIGDIGDSGAREFGRVSAKSDAWTLNNGSE